MTKELKILIASIAIIAVCAGALLWKTQKKEETSTATTPQIENLIRDFNHKSGPDSAKVKIVEFYDPECEACAAFYPYVKEVLDLHKDQVQLIGRYALYHGNSLPAAKALETAAKQGKFWEYQHTLFTRQEQWSHKQTVPMDLFVEYALNLGMDTEKFKKDFDDPTAGSLIAIDIADGQRIGVNGTPTFFINGVKLERLHPDAFKEKIMEELKK